MKIAFLGKSFDPSNPLKKNTVAYFMKKHLEAQGAFVSCYVQDLSNHNKLRAFGLKAISKLKGRYLEISRDKEILKGFGKKNSEFIKKGKFDLSFSFGSLNQAYLDTEELKSFWSDATFENLHNYYPFYCGLNKSISEGYHDLELNIFNNIQAKIFASNWATDSAVGYYEQTSNTVYEVPLGANLEIIPNRSFIKNNINLKKSNKLKIIFIGVNWKRKGGNYILKLADFLIDNKVDFEINCFGVKEKLNKKYHNIINFQGFVNKSDPLEYKKLEDCFINSHYHILMSQMEAFGHVYCEANAFGLPSIARDTGGVGSVVKNEVNGFLYKDEDSLDEFFHKIIDNYSNPSSYKQLCLSSLNEYHERLNWDVSAKKVLNILGSKL